DRGWRCLAPQRWTGIDRRGVAVLLFLSPTGRSDCSYAAWPGTGTDLVRGAGPAQFARAALASVAVRLAAGAVPVCRVAVVTGHRVPAAECPRAARGDLRADRVLYPASDHARES